MTATRLLATLGFALACASTAKADCAQTVFEDVPVSHCRFHPSDYEFRMFHRNASGQLIGSFAGVLGGLREDGEELVFATNGGMYHPDRAPVGLYIEDGRQTMRIITSDGPGNFGLLPNGVFCATERKAMVIEARRFAENPPDCLHATQSGPMLVIDGALHPKLLPDSDSRFLRNGVGVDAQGAVHFAIADAPVNFHRFARFFRDHLATPNALFLDGKVSRFFAPQLARRDVGLPLGPIIGVVARAGR